MRARSLAIAISASTVLAGCEIASQIPVITPDAPTLSSGTPGQALTATIMRGGQRLNAADYLVSCDVSLRVTPDRSTPLQGIVATQTAGNRWTCALPATLALRANDVLQFQWRVRAAAGAVVAETDSQDELLDCANEAQAMRDEQTRIMRMFPGPVTADQIIARGFAPTHGFTSFAGMGVAFARVSPGRADPPGVPQGPPQGLPGLPQLPQQAPPAPMTVAERALRSLRAPVLGRPDLLLFRPSGAAVTDAGGKDDPYVLVGWAYAEMVRADSAPPAAPSGARGSGEHRPLQPRPQLACVPRSAWFFHTAGMHRDDGTFMPSSNPVTSPRGSGAAGQGPFWHPNFWDIHFFASPDGIARPGIVIGGGATLPGIPAPPNSFYYPTAYD